MRAGTIPVCSCLTRILFVMFLPCSSSLCQALNVFEYRMNLHEQKVERLEQQQARQKHRHEWERRMGFFERERGQEVPSSDTHRCDACDAFLSVCRLVRDRRILVAARSRKTFCTLAIAILVHMKHGSRCTHSPRDP